ncbi:MAG: Gfo/Idh/MocA family oxidoreductase [Clostridia bacterium]|nr:Gfo/Idh/MocA family oxidoreductase [Clostridia bacterium]MBQ8717748.1 Gfo/Idh/MocA family oxidoreductase [Clostridia bacterium]
MYISIFSDEFYQDIYQVLPVIKSWGMTHVDFRGMINGKPIEKQTDEELHALKAALDSYGLKAGVIQSSLCKVHLPDKERQAKEQEKLEGIIRASQILGTKLVRSFFYWQHAQDDPACGELATRPDALSEVLDMFAPIAKRAREAGLILGFENCGVTPNEVICVLEALQVPEWGMAWDVSNMFELLPEAQGDCVEYFTKALKYANMVHVKSRGVPTIPELKYKKVPWERVLAGVAVTGKDMPISVETHVPADSALDKIDTCKRVYDYVKKAIPSSAPGDMKSALSPKLRFDRPYADNPVRMVVVGLGMGKNRCKQLEDTTGIQLVGVCDINEAKARAVGEQFGVAYSADIRVFLEDPTVEVMYIVTPTGTHCDIAEQCLRAGKHVLVTKPMDVTHQKCIRVTELAKELGLMLACDFDLHFRGALTELKNAVDDGFFGKLKSANMILNIRRPKEYFEENGHWRGTWALDGGGALSNQGIHEIDRILTVFGMPQAVRCTVATQTHDIEVEDYGIAEMRFENGMIARISSTTSYPASSWYTRLEVYGDRGAYLLTAGGPEGDHVYWWQHGEWSENSPYPFTKEWNQAADNFANALRTGEPLIVTAENGIRSRYVLDKMYESAHGTEGWVTI